MTTARKLHVVVPRDRILQLPLDVPEGAAEIIVLYDEPPQPLAARRGEGLDRGRFANLEAALTPLAPEDVALFEGGLGHEP